MKSQVSLGYNAVPANARASINEVFFSGQFSPGPRIAEFEEKFAQLHKAKHAVFVNSGTDALRIGLLALKEKHGWEEGDLVAVPALTFVATVNVILQAGLKPFFVDVGMTDYTLNPWNLEHRLLTAHVENLRAVMPVHLFGQACEQRIFDLVRTHKWAVLEDSCETILNPLKGDVSCHSTYMAHHVTTGVGGFALTNDEELNLLMRSYANHGRNASYLPGFFTPKLGRNLLQSRFLFNRIGYSCRGTEFEAALGLAQLDDLADNILERQLVASLLSKALSPFEDLVLPKRTIARQHTFMMFPIVLKETSLTDKYDLCLHLEKAGIETRDMMPITNQPCYRSIVREEDFPVAEWINKKGFYIPCHPGMRMKDVQAVEKAFASYRFAK